MSLLTNSLAYIKISRVKNNRGQAVACLDKYPNRSAHFHPAFTVIFSLPISLYRDDLQQHDQSQQKPLFKSGKEEQQNFRTN